MMRVARLSLLALTLCGVMLVRCEEAPDIEEQELILLQSRTAKFSGKAKASGAAVAPGRLNEKSRASADEVDLLAEDEDEHDEHDDHDDHDDEHDEHDAEHEEHGEEREESEDHMARIMRVARLADTNKDDMLSAAELRSFADGLKARQRDEQTEDAMQKVDADENGFVTPDELRGDLSDEMAKHQDARFGAADSDKDGRLSAEEFHRFVHPEVDKNVLKVELAYQTALFDANKDGFVEFEEFAREGRQTDEASFDQKEAEVDFRVHDQNGDGRLDAKEFEHLLVGQHLLGDSIEQTLIAADADGDGRIHIDSEVPLGIEGLLDSEYIEDYFFHEHHDIKHEL